MACFCSFHSRHLPHQVFSAQTLEVDSTKQGVLMALKKILPTRLAWALLFILRHSLNLDGVGSNLYFSNFSLYSIRNYSVSYALIVL